jgi:hypothetical protein
MDDKNTLTICDYMKNIKNDGMILQWKKSFNALADRAKSADKFMNDPDTNLTEKDKQFLRYHLEIVEPFMRYVGIFEKVGIELPADPLSGFPEARV